MADATIPLATPFNLNKLPGTVMVSEKFDGVPIRVRKERDGTLISTTRPGEPTTRSVEHLVAEAANILPAGSEIVFEVQHPTEKRFKKVSGMVRKDAPRPELYGVVFDFAYLGYENFAYHQRLGAVGCLLGPPVGRPLRRLMWTMWEKGRLDEAKEYERGRSDTPEKYFEGWVVADPDKPYEPGKRQPGYQKLVIEPTVDLNIWGYIEAVDKAGGLKGMVGGLVAEYQDGYIGVGPGKMKHDERTKIFEELTAEKMVGLPGKPNQVWWRFVAPRLAEIKHKRDPSYDALRQPTFQHWRDDKTEPNEES